MDAYRCIVTKRDSRSYLDRPIDEESLRRILQAGRMAGSSKNTQPCRFVALLDPQRKTELAACGQFAQHVPRSGSGPSRSACRPRGATSTRGGRRRT